MKIASKSTNFFKQCRLRKNNIETTSWIPEKFAKKGNFVKLKENDGWEVVFVSEMRQTEEECITRERDFTKQRKASDI